MKHNFRFFALLTLLGGLVIPTLTSCDFGDHRRPGLDDGPNIDFPDNGGSDLPKPEPDKPDLDPDDNKDPVDPTPDPDDNKDPVKPTPTPSIGDTFKYIRCKTTYNSIELYYDVGINTYIKNISLYNDSNNQIVQTQNYDIKEFTNVSRKYDYYIKFNYIIADTKEEMVFVTDSIGMKKPIFCADFSSVLSNRNTVEYDIVFTNEEYFSIDSLDVQIFENGSYINKSSKKSDRFIDLKQDTEYTLKVNIEASDVDSGKACPVSFSKTVRTSKAILDGTEIEFTTLSSTETSIAFEIATKLLYTHVSTELYEYNNDQPINVFYKDIRHFDNLKPGHVYSIKYNVSFEGYEGIYSFKSYDIPTMYNGDILSFDILKEENANIYYKLKEEKLPAIRYDFFKVELKLDGEVIDTKYDLEGEFTSLNDNQTYEILVSYIMYHSGTGETNKTISQYITVKDYSKHKVYMSPTFIAKDHVAFDYNCDELVQVLNFELLENGAPIETIEPYLRRFEYTPKVNCSYQVKANYKLIGSSNIRSEISSEVSPVFDQDLNTLFTYNRSNKTFNFELKNIDNPNFNLTNIEIFNPIDQTSAVFTETSGTLDSNLNQRIYYAKVEFNVLLNGVQTEFVYYYNFLNSTYGFYIDCSYSISDQNVLTYNVQSYDDAVIDSVSLFKFNSSTNEVSQIATSSKSSGHFTLQGEVLYHYLVVKHFESYDFSIINEEIYLIKDDSETYDAFTFENVTTYTDYISYSVYMPQGECYVTLVDKETNVSVAYSSNKTDSFTGLMKDKEYYLVLRCQLDTFQDFKTFRVKTKLTTGITFNSVSTSDNMIFYELSYLDNIKINRINLIKNNNIEQTSNFNKGYFSGLKNGSEYVISILFTDTLLGQDFVENSEPIKVIGKTYIATISKLNITNNSISLDYLTPDYYEVAIYTDIILKETNGTEIKKHKLLNTSPNIIIDGLLSDHEYILSIQTGYGTDIGSFADYEETMEILFKTDPIA